MFRNGDILRTNEKWYMNGKQMKMSTYYNCLGVLFSTRLHGQNVRKTWLLK